MVNKYFIKIDQIEFSLEGDAEFVKQERAIFFDSILGKLINTISKFQLISKKDTNNEILSEHFNSSSNNNEVENEENIPSLSEFLKYKRNLSYEDTVLFLGYYAEKFQKLEFFSRQDIATLFKDARLTEPQNISTCLINGVKKGYLKENGKGRKSYMLTLNGLNYLDNYQPKEKPNNVKKSKSKKNLDSQYKNITKDDLNAGKYPDISSFSKFTDKLMLIMYIFTTEKKGLAFSTNDLIYIMTEIFGGKKPTEAQISGVFHRHKTWFSVNKNESNNIVERKLLQDGKNYCETLINEKK